MATIGESLVEMLTVQSPGFPTASYTSSFILLAVTILWFLSSVSTYFQANSKGRLSLPPGSIGFPVIGETFQLRKATQSSAGYREWFRIKAKKYGPFFKTHFMGSPMVVMDSPAGTKFLFQNEGKLLENRWPASVARLLGPHSLTVKTGDHYKVTRRHLAAFLDHAAVMRYLQGLDRYTVTHFSKTWEGNEEVEALTAIRKFTFAVMCNLLMSLDEENEIAEICSNFRVWSRGLMQLPINLPGFRFYYAMKARKLIMDILEKVLNQRRQELAEGRVSERAKRDVLTNLLTKQDENGQMVSDAEVKDNLLLLLFAGFDTSSIAMAMTVYYVAQNPDVQEQLVKEHKSIMERKREKGEADTLTTEDVSAMKYSWRVIQEALRLQPPVAGAYRIATTDIEYKGYFIPKGWKMMWTNQQSHYDPKYFQDPLTFNPSRWEQSAVPFTFIPFGGGPRTCPGSEFAKMEMLVFLHHLVRRYQWSLAEPAEPLVRDPFPRTEKNTLIRITKISSF